MEPKSNIHVHTLYCDGHDSPEDMVRAAIKEGCVSLGFSAHSYIEFSHEWTLKYGGEEAYVKEISRLREKYKDKLEIFLGLERDIDSPEPEYDVYDYIIGSVHHVEKNGEFLAMDDSREDFISGVERGYGGDFLGICQDYYERLAQIHEKTGCDVIGHFDLVTKYNEDDCLFSTKCGRYREAWMPALEKLIKEDVVFEINTGAISRGCRKTPYPSAEILSAIHDMGGRVIITGDSHSKDTLFSYYDLAEELAAECGFTETMLFINGGFAPYPIKKAGERKINAVQAVRV